MTLLSMSQPKPKLIYYGDPMCSWCYGLSDELTGVVEHYGEEMDLEIVLGGLRPYNTQTMTDLKDFLTHHWEDVHKASGQEFKYAILDNDQITYDTEPPCRAVMIVRQMDATQALPFFKAVQRSFYFDNKNLHELESYSDALTQCGIDEKAFAKAWQSDVAKENIKQDFQRTANDGVNSFPTLVLEYKGKRYKIVAGFARAEQMIEAIDSVIKK